MERRHTEDNIMGILLIGMPGCGKSSLGRAAARRLNMKFLDTDTEIEKAEGRTIPEIFAEFGERYFRRAETLALRNVIGQNAVIASGGGIVTEKENLEIMKSGTVVFIDRPLECIESDIDTSGRPLLSDNGRLKRLYDERYDIYRRVCDIRILNDRDFKYAEKMLTDAIRGISNDENNGD